MQYIYYKCRTEVQTSSLASHGPHFTADKHRSKTIPTPRSGLRLRRVEDGLGFTGSLDRWGQAAAFDENPKVLINYGDIFGFLLHPLMRGRTLKITTDDGKWESGTWKAFPRASR